MNTFRTSVLAIGVSAAVTLPAMAGFALTHAAVTRASSTVTIQAQGTDLSGTLKSPRQRCVTDRKVIVIKQIGTRGGGDDLRFASDTASSDGSWSTGNTGTQGRFYAKVRANTDCLGDTSPTIRATR